MIAVRVRQAIHSLIAREVIHSGRLKANLSQAILRHELETKKDKLGRGEGPIQPLRDSNFFFLMTRV